MRHSHFHHMFILLKITIHVSRMILFSVCSYARAHTCVCIVRSAVVYRTRSTLTTSRRGCRWCSLCCACVRVSFMCKYARSFGNSFILALTADCQYDSQLCVDSEICESTQYRHPCTHSPSPVFLPPSLPFFRSNRMTRSWLIVLMQIKRICITETTTTTALAQFALVRALSIFTHKIYIFNQMLASAPSCSFKMSDYSTLWLNSHKMWWHEYPVFCSEWTDLIHKILN